MFRDFIRRLGRIFFWVSKWVTAAAILGLLLIVGIVSLLRHDIDFDTFLNYFALGLLIFVVITLFYGIIAIHDVPYEIAKARNHPHQDAIHVAGWVSLFTLHVLWPFLWIWAMLYRPDRGWACSRPRRTPLPFSQSRPTDLRSFCVGSRRSRAALRAPSSASVSNLSRNA